ncbi:MAG: type IV pilus biogenesis protein PilM [Vicinamibacterales bacterium]
MSAVEVAAGAVSGATFEWRGGRALAIAHAVEPLPERAVQPALNGVNLLEREVVVGAIGRVLERIGKPRRIGLILEDPVARISLVKLQQVPARAADLDQIIRFQVRKAAPFPIEDAQVSYVPALRSEEGQEFVVTLARRDVVVEYESACGDAGAHAGIVDLSTLNVVNAAIASGAAPAGDWLLVNVSADWASMAVLRGSSIMFFRTRGADGEGTLEDLVHQTAMYYEDRLEGAGLARALVCAAPGGAVDALVRGLAGRVSVPLEIVDPAGAVVLAEPVAATRDLMHTLTPLAGMVLRDREAAA